VIEILLRLVPIGCEGIGIVSQSADRHPRGGHHTADLVGLRLPEVRAVDMRYASVPPLGLAWGPAHHLNAIVTRIGGEPGDLAQGQVRQNGADETKLHGCSPGWPNPTVADDQSVGRAMHATARAARLSIDRRWRSCYILRPSQVDRKTCPPPS